jgi:curved DNA-binding protein CbpA
VDNHYEILGIGTTASDRQIKAAWRAGIKGSHPDRHPEDPKAETRFKRIQTAYEVLSDPAKRQIYNAENVQPVNTWQWEPGPAYETEAPPTSPPPPPPTADYNQQSAPPWVRRAWHGPNASCVSCGESVGAGLARCRPCWDIYQEELAEPVQVNRMVRAPSQSVEFCYGEQQSLEDAYGDLGYWTRQGIPRWK